MLVRSIVSGYHDGNNVQFVIEYENISHTHAAIAAFEVLFPGKKLSARRKEWDVSGMKDGATIFRLSDTGFSGDKPNKGATSRLEISRPVKVEAAVVETVETTTIEELATPKAAPCIRRRLDVHNDFGTIWTARTREFTIELQTEKCYDKYDGDDEDGEIQAGIDSGEFVYFNSRVVVECNGEEIGRDYLGASHYKSGEVSRFLHDGYFADMLRTACQEARDHINANAWPKVRSN